MSPVAVFLIAIAGIFLLGAIGEAVFRRTQIPDVVWLIVAGIVLGPLAGIVSRAQLAGIAPYFAAVTLVVVLFEGGSRLDLAALSTAAPRSGLLALLTFGSAVALVAPLSVGLSAVGWLSAAWTWKHGLLLGCILGGSSSIIIMPAMAQARVEPPVANLVNLESAFTDAFCVVGASALVDLIIGGAAGEGSPWLALARSFGLGLLCGGVGGLLWILVLRPLKGSDHAYPITLSALLLLYVGIERVGGSAALGILAFAIIVGNAPILGRLFGFVAPPALSADVRGVHSQIAFIIKSFFFTFIGAMIAPPWSLIAMGVLLGIVLLLARVPGALLATLGSGLGRPQKELVIIALPRGMAAGVLATLPAAAGVKGTAELPTVVFACVLTTIVAFAVGFPLVRRRAARGEGPGLGPAEAQGPVAAPDPDAEEAKAAEAGAGAPLGP